MNEQNMYDKFSQNYDRFVNWDARLSSEIPFLLTKLSALARENSQKPWILDTACGTGHHAIALAKQGFNCIGADVSAGMIDIARENAINQDVQVVFKRVGFGDLDAAFGSAKFDGLLCLGNSLPHVLGEENLLKALADFRTVLKKNGLLIIQNRNFDKVMAEKNRWMEPQTYREADHTWIFSRFYDFEDDEQLTFNIQILTSQAGEDFTQEIISTSLWPIRKETILKTLKKSGFKSLQFYGNLEGAEFNGLSSPNLVVVTKAG
ncbi:MAG: class I SAM-dependent methyltransferase [Brevefilum sp.]|nr:class I SAM-dependent methyltransferase [Brevefilum sp.]MDW7753728.1 class I SAM-dependent methyltransferase [Brevefilum sp.]